MCRRHRERIPREPVELWELELISIKKRFQFDHRQEDRRTRSVCKRPHWSSISKKFLLRTPLAKSLSGAIPQRLSLIAHLGEKLHNLLIKLEALIYDRPDYLARTIAAAAFKALSAVLRDCAFSNKKFLA